LAAWNGGDSSSLSAKNKKILEACTTVIDTLILEIMTEYEKEMAIHDWMISWADYDMEAASNAPDARPDPDNDNPYGLLFRKKAICRGYTVTFQLFMDMIGIECITVEGTSRDGGEPHAWNMVRLDGEWYCVDVTWDDPVGSGRVDAATSHRYFNVTSQHLRDRDHQWDESLAPEATATKYKWQNQ
jgi:transglutaminase/protease-like cytokinesis protein 3